MLMATFGKIIDVGQQLEHALSEECLSVLKNMPELQSGCDELLKNAMTQLAKAKSKALVENDGMKVLVDEVSRSVSSMLQLVDFCSHWDGKTDGCYNMLYILFSTGLLHIERDNMVNWIQRLDDIFELLTEEEYVPREDDHKRDVHRLVFYLNAYAKVMTSEQDEQDKLEMYQLMASADNRNILNIVASIYYANPRLCGGYNDFTAVAGSLIAKVREHYVVYFLTAEKYARHERNCKFQWHSKHRYYYNDMVNWWQNKSQNTNMVRLLSVIWPKVDWEPTHNSFHLKRDKRPGDVEVPTHIKDYIDVQVKNGKEEVDKDLEYLNRRLTDEVTINRQEHLMLSERLGRVNGTTNNYYGNIGQQIGSAQEVSYHDNQTKI